MKKEWMKYTANLKDDFSVRFKEEPIAPKKPFHIHSQFEIIFSMTHQVFCEMDDTMIPVPAGSFLLLNHMDLHRIFSGKEGPCSRYVLFFSPDYLSGFSDETDLLECFVYRSFPTPQLLPASSRQESEKAAALFRQLLAYQEGPESRLYGAELSKKLILAQLLLLINRRYREFHQIQDLQSEDRAVFYRVINYISCHYQEPLSVDRLCKTFYLTRPGLVRMFQQICRESPGEYLIRFRIEKAKEFLRQDYPVETAASLSGYQNAAHFSRIFRQRTGLSPKQYQLQRRSDRLHSDS